MVSLTPGQVIRQVRTERGMTQSQLGARMGYSIAQVSRYERGQAALNNVDVIRRFAEVLGISAAHLGLEVDTDRRQPRTARALGAVSPFPYPPPHKVVSTHGREDDVRRRSFLILTAATAASAPDGTTGPGQVADPRAALVENLRDAMLGLGGPQAGSGSPLPKQLARVQADYAACRYTELSRTLPAFMRAAHAEGDVGMMAQAYLAATRMLIKVDDHALGWMAADRARQLSGQHDDARLEAEADQQLVVLCRRSGWTDRAMSIAVNAADNPRLARVGAAGTAMRGLLLSSATYTVSKTGDRSGMRQLSGEAAALAAGFDSKRAHVGGCSGDFSSATVQLYRIAAEFSAGDPKQALNVAKKLRPADLPTIERRARYYADVAAAQAHLGDRDGCLRALLAAERQAPEETYSRPAVRALITGLLVSGRTTSDMRALAARSRVSA